MRTLNRLFPCHDIDALLGDIAEERPRRSRFWYWCQLLAIVVVASWRDIRAHPLIALRAIVTGFATLTVWFGVALAIGYVLRVFSNGGYYFGGYWLTLPHFTDRWPYDPLAVITTNALGFFLSGWTIVRLHRAHGIAMVISFLIMATLLALTPLVIVLNDTGPGTRSMPIAQIVGILGTLFLSIPFGILLGGLLGLHSRRSLRR
jgi:hypothetical protein